jgi:hypothetical protein
MTVNTVQDQLLKEVRSWIASSTSLTSSKIIPTGEGQNGVPHPDIPFVTIQLTNLHQPVGVGETVKYEDQGSNAGKMIFNHYETDLLLTGFGLSTSEELLTLDMKTSDAPLALRSLSGLTNQSVSPKDKEDIEARYQQDYRMTYRVKVEGPAVPELKTVNLQLNELESETETDIQKTVQLDVS